MSHPAWADALLSGVLRRHGKDSAKVRRVVLEFEKELDQATTRECRAGFEHVIAELKAHLATMELPLEPERFP